MGTQPRLFRLAPEALTVSAHFTPMEGWTAAVTVRRGDEMWSDVEPHSYGALSTAELYDVICADLAGQLGL